MSTRSSRVLYHTNKQWLATKSHVSPWNVYRLRAVDIHGGAPLKAYKTLNFRLYPNENQQILINKTFGCCRFIYNTLLAAKSEHFNSKNSSKFRFHTEKELKAMNPWLKEINSIALQQSRINLQNAYSNFFNSISGKRKGLKIGPPKFKTKHSKQTFRTSNVKISFDNKILYLPKIGWIKFSDDRRADQKEYTVTISKNRSNQYFAAIKIQIDIPDQKILIEENRIFAADMSCKDFLISDQEKFTNPRSYRSSEKKLARFQRKMSKKKLESKNRNKIRIKVCRIHRKIKSTKDDFLHKTSRYLVDKYDAIILEDLNIEGMKRFGVGKSVAQDFSFGTFVKMIEYKAAWTGKHFIRVGRFFPSSKLCNSCGLIKETLSLSERQWKCECGVVHDRDINASRNIMREGKRILGFATVDNTESYACGETDRWDLAINSKSVSMKQESMQIELY